MFNIFYSIYIHEHFIYLLFLSLTITTIYILDKGTANIIYDEILIHFITIALHHW